MSWQRKKSLGGAAALMLLGTAAIFGGAKWLALVIPLALLVYSSIERSYNGGNKNL